MDNQRKVYLFSKSQKYRPQSSQKHFLLKLLVSKCASKCKVKLSYYQKSVRLLIKSLLELIAHNEQIFELQLQFIS